jgi:myosin-5
LCAGAPASERKEFELGDFTNFHYLNQSGTGIIPGVDDVAEFEITQRSLSTVGIAVQMQWQIFRLLAALLHIGNIQVTGRTDAVVSDSDPALITATKLLGIELPEFRKWIIKKQIITRSEKIVTNLNVTQAQVVKDSVAKYVYANLFDWLVSIINQSLSAPQVDDIKTFIGVLDIYGFEHFKKNSFEQFCINYANEKLQQEFNQHVFKLEQEEYIREEINWKFIEFSDNQKCIEMIEGKMGILSLLDEESRLPSGTDQGYCNKLYTTFDKPPFKDYFKKPRFSNSAFTVVHYAHDVQYESEGFLDKNKDTVPDEHLVLLQSSKFDFLVDVLNASHAGEHAPSGETNHKRMSVIKKPTLGSIFKQSLISLMDTIGQTNVHYIRCIKPNEAKVAWEFEPNMVLAQLRACGVLETIRISCAGYPSRWTFEEFAERYYALVNSKHWDPSVQPDVRRLTGVILDTWIQDNDKYQIGKSKIFFRAGQLAYLEKLRADRWNDCAILLQKNMRRFIIRIRYLRMRDLALRLQSIARKKVGQAKLQLLREEKAAILIQKNWRRYITRKRYVAHREFIIHLQNAVLGYVGRKRHAVVREHNAAIQIQRMVRGWAARRKFQAQRNHVIRIQTCFRRRQARKQLLALKAEARSVSHFKEVSYKLESKVVELTQTLTKQKEEKLVLQEKAAKLEQQVRAWVEKYDKLDKRAKELETTLQEPKISDEWDSLQHERDSLQTNYQSSLDKIRKQDNEIARLTEELTKQKSEVANLRQASHKMAKYIDEPDINELKSQITALKAQLSQTLNQPRRQNSLNSNGNLRNLSPVSERSRGMSPGAYDRQENGFVTSAQRGRSPTGNATPYRRNSIAEAKKNKVKTSLDRVSQMDVRATSIDQLGVRDNVDDDFHGSPAEIVYLILHDEDGLQDEILEGLIRHLKIPQANTQTPLSRKEVLFPAHAISITASQMWKLGYMQESERLLYTVMDTIQKQCLVSYLHAQIFNTNMDLDLFY